MTALGVHSETGRLREVIVHRPDLSLRRLTPDNCKALLFDDVLWVKRARKRFRRCSSAASPAPSCRFSLPG